MKTERVLFSLLSPAPQHQRLARRKQRKALVYLNSQSSRLMICLATCLASRLACLMCVISAVGCSFVEFEPSPYTPRDLKVVYSPQEDLTFLSWRLRESADLSLVRFEYWDTEAELWRPLSLSNSPYPASPYACGLLDVCLQAQLEGRFVWADLTQRDRNPPLRALHEEGGVYGPLELQQVTAERTFDVTPIAIDKNLRFDPKRFDWFADNNVPLKRAYEWRLVESEAGLNEEDALTHTLDPCKPSRALSAWRSLEDRVLSAEWTSSAACLSARPLSNKRDFEPAVVTTPLPPSALLTAREERYRAPTLTPPAFFISLSDLLVRSERRCAQLKSEILTALREGFSRFPSATREDLGDFTPVTPVGDEPLLGCAQEANRQYPLVELLERVKGAVNPLAPEGVSLIIVYINNSDEPLSPELSVQLDQLFDELTALEHLKVYGIKVSGEGTPDGYWRHFIPWRALEVSSFEDQLLNLGERVFPFRTLDFVSGETSISLPAPRAEASPLSFKLCELTPERFLKFEIDGEVAPFVERDQVTPWGAGANPLLYVDLPPQDRVDDDDYREERVSAVYEVCVRFCDYPFRSQSGVDFSSWLAEQSCQWGAR